MEPSEQSRRKTRWGSVVFLVVFTLLTVVAAPIYIYYFGISRSEILLFLFYAGASSMSISLGYHRLFSHVAFKAHPVVQFFVLFFGAAAFEQSALKWSSQHRKHHKFVDTEQDPYNIKKGFFYAHIGWLLFWKHPVNYDNVKDLQKSSLIMHQHNYYQRWAFVSGVITPLLLGALTGHLLGAFLFSVGARITLVHHSAFFINSYAHTFGTATYDFHISAKDHWLGAIVTNGEGYHSYHHRFPSDYRNGVLWHHWDPAKWLIWLLSRAGLASDLRSTSRFRILEARMAAGALRANELLAGMNVDSDSFKAIEALNSRHERIKESLASWEDAVRQHQVTLRENGTSHSKELQEAGLKKSRAEKKIFKRAHGQWNKLLSRDLSALQKSLLQQAAA